MNKITIVFCEGQHDIAFLSKILYAHGYKKYNKKLKSFEKPFGARYIKLLEKQNISDRKLGFQSNYIVPSVSVYKGENLVLFHNMGGDGKSKAREEVREMYIKLKGEKSEDEFTSTYEFDYKFLYFLDADDYSVQHRVDQLNTELNLNTPIKHNEIVKDTYDYGCYIYHVNVDSGGVLEDILLDLMKPTNETYFQNSEGYITTCSFDSDRQKEYKCYEDDYKEDNKFKKKKSILSIAGQLQFSGMNNSVIIANSDYIKKTDIESNTHCKNIVNLFN